MRMAKFFSRKFIFAIGVFVTVVILKLVNMLGDSAFAQIVIGLFGFYSSANAVSKFANNGR
jgi:hypothetical protein